MRRNAVHSHPWVWLMAAVPLLELAFCFAPVCKAAEVNAPKAKVLLAHYMPWFESKSVRGEWGKHWTGNQGQFNPEKLDTQGLPELAAHYHPLLGPYDSSDPHVIECHLLQMKLAGIDGVIVDWYGISKHADYPAIHTATEAIFRGTARYGLKFAVCFEDRTIKRLVESGELKSEQVPAHLADTLVWLDENWFAAPSYVRVDSQPLLLNFGPIYVTEPAAWQTAFAKVKNPPRFFALNHLWKAAQADGGFTWVYPQVWETETSRTVVLQRLQNEFYRESSKPTETVVSAIPGFNDRYPKSYPDIAHRDGETLRESLDVAMNGPWPIVQLVTWNDFGEGTMIEPCHEFGYSLLKIVQQARRAELKNQFLNTTADLRLPEKLYRMRKKATSQLESIDEAAELLARGEADAARQLLERISDESSSQGSHRSLVRPQYSRACSIQLASSIAGEGKRF
jgi:hypothetical protein